MLGRLTLEDCVHCGPQMWPELVQKSYVAGTSPGPHLRPLPLPRLPPTMPISSLLVSSESPRPPLYPPRSPLLSFLSPFQPVVLMQRSVPAPPEAAWGQACTRGPFSSF